MHFMQFRFLIPSFKFQVSSFRALRAFQVSRRVALVSGFKFHVSSLFTKAHQASQGRVQAVVPGFNID